MNTDTLTDAEFDRCFFEANIDWRNRLCHESRRIHYDYDSDIIQLRFGRPGFSILNEPYDDDGDFSWVVEYECLNVVGVEIFNFRHNYAPRYPKLQAAYDAMCRDWGEGDWHIHILPQAETKAATAASTFADTLLECARDPVPVSSPEI